MPRSDGPPVLEARALEKIFTSSWFSQSVPKAALAGVSVCIERRLAITGPSGSGKSTLARCLAGLAEPTGGGILYRGDPASPLLLRDRVQLVMQDAGSALDPRFTALENITEPLRIRRPVPRQQWRSRALALMDEVGLPRGWADALPVQFSGGQQKRVALARALAVTPEVLILDEVLAGLDISMQARILNLLIELEQRRGVTVVLITHDQNVAEAFAGPPLIMHDGRVAGPRLRLAQGLGC